MALGPNDVVNPLTEEHFRQITDGLQKAELAQAQIDLAKRAGIPVEQQEKDLNVARERLRMLKEVYFPGR